MQVLTEKNLKGILKAFQSIDASGDIVIEEEDFNHILVALVNEGKMELTLFLHFLVKEGYCDSDVYHENHDKSVIDQYNEL